MKIENPQLKLGIRHILSGIAVLCNAGLAELADGEPMTPDDANRPETETPKNKGGRPRKVTPEQAAPQTAAASQPGEPQTSTSLSETTPAATTVAQAITHDMLRTAIQQFVGLPNSGGIDAAKKIVIAPFGVLKISEIAPEQLPTAYAAIQKAAEAAKATGEL